MRGTGTVLGAIALVAGFAIAQAQDLPRIDFKVAGSPGSLASWSGLEKPFWNALPAASGGAFTATAQSVTERGLKGAEVMRLLKIGQLDFAHVLPAYVAENAWIEASGIAGVARDRDMARKVTTVWAPRLDALMDKDHNAKILNWYALPTQMIFCRVPIKSLADLKGRKVQVQSVSQGDLIEGLGATAVSIPFAEAASALQRGTVDCGIAGALPAYKAGWHQVVTHMIQMPVDFPIIFTAVGMTTWRGLNGKSRELLSAQMKAFEDKAWEMMADEAAMGLVCMSGLGGTCSAGKPGTVTRIQPSSADLKLREKVLTSTVLKRWAARCGAECVRAWNDTAGRMASVTAAP
jgi:TRAP-type C4-dicarboxylate transport system substrate-binding protein